MTTTTVFPQVVLSDHSGTPYDSSNPQPVSIVGLGSGAIATAAVPSYVEASTDALSMDLSGKLRVTGTFWQTTQPVSVSSTVSVTEKWAAGTLAADWTDVGVGTTVNSLASGSAIICSTAIDNSSTLDQFFALSINLGSITPGSGFPYVGFYRADLNEDGSTYGHGGFASAVAATPPFPQACYIPGNPSTAGVVTGAAWGLLLPKKPFKLIMLNLLGSTLASSANVIKFLTYNRSAG